MSNEKSGVRPESQQRKFSPKFECEATSGCQLTNNQCVEVGYCIYKAGHPAPAAPAEGPTPRTDVTEALEARQNAYDAAQRVGEDGHAAASAVIVEALSKLDSVVVRLEREVACKHEREKEIEAFYEEWPGGLEEVESSLKQWRERAGALSASGTIDAEQPRELLKAMIDKYDALEAASPNAFAWRLEGEIRAIRAYFAAAPRSATQHRAEDNPFAPYCWRCKAPAPSSGGCKAEDCGIRTTDTRKAGDG